MTSERPKYEEDGTRETTSRVAPQVFPQHSSSEEETSNTTTSINTTSWMATIGALTSTISLVLLGIAIPADNSNFKKIGMVLLIVGIIFALLAPIYMMTSFPGAIKDDDFSGEDDQLPDHDHPAKSFFGSYSENSTYGDGEVTRSWGGGSGWFMSLIAGALLVVSIILVAIGGKEEKSTTGEVTEPGRQQAQEPRSQEESQFYGEEDRETSEGQQQPAATGTAATGATEETAETCSTCGQGLRYIDEYDRWYCDNCQEYK
ncbi:MAG: hypothetical protein KGY76_01735 [Candidatus Thermoplasmatota archaeon]|nr:hypothetical protein [Candidatus Thermoplasmatota archaeon]